MEEEREGIYLIGAQFVFGVQVLREAGGDYFFEKTHIGGNVELFVQKFV